MDEIKLKKRNNLLMNNMMAYIRQSYTVRRRSFGALFFAILLMCAAVTLIPSVSVAVAEGDAVKSMQETLDETGLPTIYIRTIDEEIPTFEAAKMPEGMPGGTITNNKYVKGYCQITNLGSGRSFSSPMKLKVRGNVSALRAGVDGKLPYKLVLKKEVDLLGNGQLEKRYVLLAIAGENLKTYLGFLIGKYCGIEWTPDYRYVNVVLNDDYRGIYLLVSALDGISLSDHVKSNGFMIECDTYWWNESVYFNTEAIGRKMAYTFKYPKGKWLTNTRLWDIRKYMETLDEELRKDHHSDLIDEESFIAWIMTRDITGDGDSAGANMYYYLEVFNAKDPARFKLHMGPLWDFDSTFTDKRDGKWSAQRNSRGLYFRYLFKDDGFSAQYADCWRRISLTLYNELEAKLQELVDAKGKSINTSRKLDAERWGKTFVPLEEEIEEKLAWLRNRMAWIDSELKAEESGQ